MSATAAIIFSVLAAGAGAENRSVSVSAADLAKARELVRQLADAKFKVRDAAERELIHMGLAALDALKEGEKFPDYHVQERCRQLQPEIRSLTLQKRINSFIAKSGAPLPKDLPFVAKFIKVAGDSKEARELYGTMLQTNAELLDEVERDRKKGAGLFASYCQEIAQRAMYRPGVDIRQRQRLVTKADIALYLLLSPELNNTDNLQHNNFGYTFLNSPNLSENLGQEPGAAPFKKIFLNWLEKEPLPYLVERGVQVAADAKMAEAVSLVVKHVKNTNAPPYSRAQLMLLLAKLGAKEHLAVVEPFLGDKTVVSNVAINNVQGQVQVRDVALAVSIKLSGQKFADYDFDVMKGANENLIHMSYIYCAFSSDKKRDAAHKKYKDSIAAQKKE